MDSDTINAVHIEELREAGEDGGDLMGYWCKGHVDRWRFANAANHYSGAADSYDMRHVRADKVMHVWWRTVPMAGEPGCFRFIDAEPRARGAFAATVCDCVEAARLATARREVNAFDRGRRNGIAEGVNWCLRELDNFAPSVTENLLARFRNQRDRLEKEQG